MAVFFPFEIIPYLVLVLLGLLYCMFRFNTVEYGRASVYICGVLQVVISAALSLAFTNNSIAAIATPASAIANTGLMAVFALWALLAAAYTLTVWLVTTSKDVGEVRVR